MLPVALQGLPAQKLRQYTLTRAALLCADCAPDPAGQRATSAIRPAPEVGLGPLGPPSPASWVSRELPHGCPTGLAAHGTARRSGRRKCVKAIELLVPEEGGEPSRGVSLSGF
jgi:hypothetical protein